MTLLKFLLMMMKLRRAKMTRANIKYMSDSAIDYLKANTRFVSRMIMENPDSSGWLKVD